MCPLLVKIVTHPDTFNFNYYRTEGLVQDFRKLDRSVFCEYLIFFDTDWCYHHHFTCTGSAGVPRQHLVLMTYENFLIYFRFYHLKKKTQIFFTMWKRDIVRRIRVKEVSKTTSVMFIYTHEYSCISVHDFMCMYVCVLPFNYLYLFSHYEFQRIR